MSKLINTIGVFNYIKTRGYRSLGVKHYEIVSYYHSSIEKLIPIIEQLINEGKIYKIETMHSDKLTIRYKAIEYENPHWGFVKDSNKGVKLI